MPSSVFQKYAHFLKSVPVSNIKKQCRHWLCLFCRLTADLGENRAVMRVDFQVAKIFRFTPVEDTQSCKPVARIN